MKGMAQDGHREWAGRGQARLRQENSRTASGTSHKMQNKKKVEVWIWAHWAGLD